MNRVEPRRPTAEPVAAGLKLATRAIEADGLSKKYENGRIVAIDTLSLSVSAGESIAIVGPSGCGKSTLLNLIAAMDRPDAGDLLVFGANMNRLKRAEADRFRAETIGFVFQLHNLLPHLTAHENVQIPMIARGVTVRERSERAAELLRRVGLADRITNLPTTLSGGERQRVAVARALANSPRLILADEPTGALDSRSGEQVLELLLQIHREDGVTLLLVTHDALVANSASRVVQMRDGRIHTDQSSDK